MRPPHHPQPALGDLASHTHSLPLTKKALLAADYSFLRFQQSTVAAAVAASSRQSLGVDCLWPAELERVTGVRMEDMEECYSAVQCLQHTVAQREDTTNNHSRIQHHPCCQPDGDDGDQQGPENFEPEQAEPYSPKSVCSLFGAFGPAFDSLIKPERPR